MKKAIALAGMLFVLGVGFASAQDMQRARNTARERSQARLFVDQNGDGICDLNRDHDGDGVPNCQDTDWARPGDGTGYKGGQGQGGGNPALQNRSGYRGGRAMDKGSFRQNRANRGGGVCDGTGPKGQAGRKGRG